MIPKNLYEVIVEWAVKELPIQKKTGQLHVVAATADLAVEAAVAAERNCFVEELEYCRLQQVRLVTAVDVVVQD